MQGLILQLEEAKAHRYHQHIDMMRQFLSWKTGKDRLNRSKINLLHSVQNTDISYSKDEISRFQEHAWNGLLRLSPKSLNGSHDITLLDIGDKSKRLFPRHSSRSTDTKVMSLLHGNDLCFKAFKSRVTGNCDPHCPNCPTADDNFHRIFICPLFNCSFRDALQQHSSSVQPSWSWSILVDRSDEGTNAFRCLAQLAIADLTCR